MARALAIDVERLVARPLPLQRSSKARCESLLAGANCTLSEVVAVATADPALAIAVLRRVNEARGADRVAIASIESAVNLLGQDQLRRLLRTIPLLEEQCSAMHLSAARALLERQRHAGMQAAHWARMREDKSPGECRIAAMCHGIGELMVCIHEPQAYAAAPGRNHTDVGRAIAQRWSMPELIVDALTPARHEFYRPLGIMLANELARLAETGWYSEPAVACVELVADYLGVGFSTATRMVHDVALGCAREGVVPGALPAAARLVQLPAVERGRPVPARSKAPVRTRRETPQETGQGAHERMRRMHGVLLHAKQCFHSDGIDASTVLHTLVRLVHKGLGFRRAVLFLREDGGRHLRARLGAGCASDSPLTELSLPLDSAHLFQRMLEKPQSLWVNPANLARYAEHVPAAFKEAAGVGEFTCMSLFAGEQPLGLMYADAGPGARIDADAYTAFKQICALGNQALTRLRPARSANRRPSGRLPPRRVSAG